MSDTKRYLVKTEAGIIVGSADDAHDAQLLIYERVMRQLESALENGLFNPDMMNVHMPEAYVYLDEQITDIRYVIVDNTV